MKFLLSLFFSICCITSLYSSQTKELIENFNATKQEIKNGAVVLKKEVIHNLDKNNIAESTYYYLIALLDDKALQDYAHISFSYNSFFKNHKIEFARIISNDGSIKDLRKDALQIKTPNNNMYNDSKTIEFSLPNMKKGSFIEYKITLKNKNQIIKDNWSQGGNLNIFQTNKNNVRIDSVRESILNIIIDKSNKLFTKFYNIKSKPEIKVRDGKKEYKWKFKNLPKYKYEVLPGKSYRKILPRYTISTIKNWDVLTEDFNNTFKNKIILSPKIIDLANDITRNLKTDNEKIKAIFNYIQKNIKYVFANLGSGGFTPHTSEEILENLYGDCKDQTILFISLLKAINIQAYPSLVNASPFLRLDKNIVSPKYFNHMITYIPSKNLWIDTTGSNFSFPGTSINIVNKPSLIIKDKAEIKKIQNQQDNRISIIKKYSFVEEYHTVDVEINFLGEYSNVYKNLFNSLDDKFIDNYKAFIKRLYPNGKLEKFKFTNLNNNKKTVKLNYKIKANDKIDTEIKNNPIVTYSGTFDSFIMDQTTLMQLRTPEDTKYGFYLGSKVNIEITEYLKAPIENSKGTFKIIPNEYDTKYISSTFKQSNDSNDIKITTSYKIKERFVKPNEYSEFYKTANQILSNSMWVVEYNYDPFYKKQLSLKNNNSLESKIDLAKSYLNSMQLEEAKKVLEDYIDTDKTNYELNYTYGVILGLLGEDELSEQYLEIADKIKH